MKRCLYMLCMIPMLAIGQHDFETRYFTIDAKSLPELSQVSPFALAVTATVSFDKKSLSDFTKVTSNNYWQAVDMAKVLGTEQTSFTKAPTINYPKLESKEFGFSFSVNGNNSFDGTRTNGIKNIAYKEMRSIYLCAPAANYQVNNR